MFQNIGRWHLPIPFHTLPSAKVILLYFLSLSVIRALLLFFIFVIFPSFVPCQTAVSLIPDKKFRGLLSTIWQVAILIDYYVIAN